MPLHVVTAGESHGPGLTCVVEGLPAGLPILVEDVAYFKAEDKYTVVVTAEGEALIRKPIRELLEALDPAAFKQVHRSTIVNMRAIAAVARDETGRGTIRLKNRPEALSVSIPYMALFRNM